jgi:hypothetical protein
MDLLDRELSGIRANFLAVFGLVSIERGEWGAAEERLFRDPATAILNGGYSGAIVLCQRGALRLATDSPRPPGTISALRRN